VDNKKKRAAERENEAEKRKASRRYSPPLVKGGKQVLNKVENDADGTFFL
jgi:hypothetical protein